jgi:hypothetical protein
MEKSVIIANRITASAFSENMRNMDRLLYYAEECKERNNGDDVPNGIRNLSMQIDRQAHEMKEMLDNDRLNDALSTLKDIEDKFSRHCDLVLKWLKGKFPNHQWDSRYREEMNQHYCPYIDGTQFEIDLKNEIHKRKLEPWKQGFDRTRAVNAIFGTIKSMMNPYVHKNDRAIDMSQYGMPRGWRVVIETWLGADKKTMDIMTRIMHGTSQERCPGTVFYSNESYSDDDIIDHAKQIVDCILANA